VVHSFSIEVHFTVREDDQVSGRLRFGVFELDLHAGELRKDGLRVRLQEQPFQVLATLLEQPGEVVTRETLQKKLWPADTFVDFDHGLNKAISKIREALSDSAASPRFVETVARRGYRFLAEVKVADAAPVRSPELATLLRPLAEARDRPELAGEPAMPKYLSVVPCVEDISLRAPSTCGLSLLLEASFLEPPVTCHSLLSRPAPRKSFERRVSGLLR